MRAALCIALGACTENQTPQPEPAPVLPDCVPNRDGAITSEAVMIAAAALSHFWITPTMVSLRGAMGGHIDDVPMSDPLRMRFNDLHQYSVALMGTAMIAGFFLLLLTVRSWTRR